MREGHHASISIRLGLTSATVVLVAVLHSGPVAAQPVSCAELYQRLMALYRSAPQSPEYSQMSAAYNGRCGAEAGGTNPGRVGTTGAPPQANLPLRGAPTNTV